MSSFVFLLTEFFIHHLQLLPLLQVTKMVRCITILCVMQIFLNAYIVNGEIDDSVLPSNKLEGDGKTINVESIAKAVDSVSTLNVKADGISVSTNHTRITNAPDDYEAAVGNRATFNERFEGPPSETVTFDTPEGVPSSVQSLDAYQMGASALLLVWERPQYPNGILTGYTIGYEAVMGTQLGPYLAPVRHAEDADQTRFKLPGLQPNTKYRIHVRPTTQVGEGDDYYIERMTRVAPLVPDKPRFTCVRMPAENDSVAIKVIWLPVLVGAPGSHFFVKYKLKDETMFKQTPNEINKNVIEVQGLQPDAMYEFRVVAVDGDLMTEGDPQDVDTSSAEEPITDWVTAAWSGAIVEPI